MAVKPRFFIVLLKTLKIKIYFAENIHRYENWVKTP